MTKRGFGTNFHQVYASDPEIYHRFSAAEVFPKNLKKKMDELCVSGVLLDVACGTAHKTALFSENFEKVYALDFSKELLQFAEKKYRRNKKLNFIWSSAAHIPLLDESVDTILVTWGSFPLAKTLGEMKRVLKKGGAIIRIGAIEKDQFTSLFPHFDERRIQRINKAFQKAGFTIEKQVVEIQFKSLKEAKELLHKIVGAPKTSIAQTSLKHSISLCHYKKI